MKDIIITALSSGLLTGILTWAAARRKTLAEAQTNELENVNKAVGYYREMLDDMAGRYKEAIKELQGIKDQMSGLEAKLIKLAAENRALIEELKKYKQLNGKRNE
jgi:chromosome segregation ATPase